VFRDSRVVQFKCRRRTSSYRFQCRMHYSLRDEVLFDANERAGREDLGNCVVGQSWLRGSGGLSRHLTFRVRSRGLRIPPSLRIAVPFASAPNVKHADRFSESLRAMSHPVEFPRSPSLAVCKRPSSNTKSSSPLLRVLRIPPALHIAILFASAYKVTHIDHFYDSLRALSHTTVGLYMPRANAL
jgi:hypothetical protein